MARARQTPLWRASPGRSAPGPRELAPAVAPAVPPAVPPPAKLALAANLALALALGPSATARAQAPASTSDKPAATDPAATDPAASDPAASDPAVEPEPLTAPPAQPKVELVAPPNNVSQSAGVGGRAVADNDPEGKRARADLEGSSLSDKPAEGVPERLPPLQRGGWWCVFGAFAFASVGGVFGGLAEAEEDRATRLVVELDPATGSQLQYAEIQPQYEEILARGRRDATLAQAFIGIGAGVLVAGIGLFIADRVGRKRPARVSAGAGGLQVRF